MGAGCCRAPRAVPSVAHERRGAVLHQPARARPLHGRCPDPAALGGSPPGASPGGVLPVTEPADLGYLNSLYARDSDPWHLDRKSTRLNSSHLVISYAVFCLK